MELIVLCFIFLNVYSYPNGYIYPRPEPPFSFDEPITPVYLPPPPSRPPFQDDTPPSSSIPTYIPPDIFPPIENDIIPPPIIIDNDANTSPPSNHYLLPPINNQYIPPSLHSQMRILNMSCLNSNKDNSGFFQTYFQTQRIPMFESSSPNCLIRTKNTNLYSIDLDGSRMIECGVKNCDNNRMMCILLRMGTIQGLRLPEDTLITLQCLPQEPIVSQTKHLKLNTQNDQRKISGKSFSTLTGGSQRRFDSKVQILKKNTENNNFDQLVHQGGIVKLGDELMLRVGIKNGDGWNAVKLGSVIIRSAATQNSLIMVNDEGCRRSQVKTICPQQPQLVGPLTIIFPFRAFLFQGNTNTDELLLSVRIFGCIRSSDCIQKNCDETTQFRPRVLRSILNNLSDENHLIIEEFQSNFNFKVETEEAPIKYYSYDNKYLIIALFVFITIVFLYILIKLIKKLFFHSN